MDQSKVAITQYRTADALMLDRELVAELEAWEQASDEDFLRWEASLEDEEG
jgi:hypothetical protein